MESVGRLNCIAVDGDSHMRGGQCDNIHVLTTAAVPSPLGWRMDDNGGFGLDEVRVRKAWTPASGYHRSFFGAVARLRGEFARDQGLSLEGSPWNAQCG